MAMTLRLTADETEALHARAALEGRSPHDVARQAIRDYLERVGHSDSLDAIIDREFPGYADAITS